MKCKIIQHFIGKINGVIINKEHYYYTIGFICYQIEDIFNIKLNDDNSQNLISLFESSLHKLYMKQDVCQNELENYIFNNLQNSSCFIPENCCKYRGDYFKEVNNELKKLIKIQKES